MPYVPPVEAQLVVAFPPAEALPAEDLPAVVYPPFAALLVAFVPRLRAVVVPFVEDET